MSFQLKSEFSMSEVRMIHFFFFFDTLLSKCLRNISQVNKKFIKTGNFWYMKNYAGLQRYKEDKIKSLLLSNACSYRDKDIKKATIYCDKYQMGAGMEHHKYTFFSSSDSLLILFPIGP